MTIEIRTRKTYADILRAVRANGTLQAYGRLGSFGRVIITTDGARYALPHWTTAPALNIHRRPTC